MILTDEQRLEWLRLIRSEKIGPRTFRALVNQYGGAAAALEALPDLARRGGRLMLKVCTRAEAENEMDAAARLGARFIAMGEPDYPKTLKAIDTAPPLIAVRGTASILARPSVAIIGSRNASASGLTFAERLSRQLGGAGYVVVSGLARGIDTRAHKASLETGTVAVLAGGHDRIYPSQNEPLLQAIVEQGGAVVSEMPMGWEPRGRDFPRRNRIVSGLSYGVVVVEAARRSGSLITARFALEQGREVFAVPGSPLDPRAEGTNDLIREGATLCAGIDHVTSVLDPLIASGPDLDRGAEEPHHVIGVEELWDELDLPDVLRPPVRQVVPDPGFEEERGDGGADLIAFLGPSPVAIDDLVRQSGLSIRNVQMALLELEMAGRLERHGGNAVSLILGH
ncbi:DNA-processing protein DprA [Microvirga lotononidis]|uniref:DNA protecting protein DprA n=1 Tax=Microvirga lotononidis TaxID=864069 RepID=I4Z008_9HYPH|nr:DNA-processing protein DprA [Microvirga lotononidis]EIM29550.1 DNA protecting protein DprA [Microvirga lotononidis]WQO27140.1 DNA-processing protein DprA [Microvirga lotononidis]